MPGCWFFDAALVLPALVARSQAPFFCLIRSKGYAKKLEGLCCKALRAPKRLVRLLLGLVTRGISPVRAYP